MVKRISREFQITRFTIAVFALIFCQNLTDEFSYAQSTLRLSDGDIFQGEITDKMIDRSPDDDRESLYWKCSAFVEPMVVPWKMVDAISKNRDNGDSGARGEDDLYLLEFENGECISGKIERFSEQMILLSSKRFPVTEVELNRVRAILKVNNSTYEGVGRLSVNEWKQVLPVKKKDVPDSWNSKSGSIETSVAGSTIVQTATLPPLAVLDVDVAWTHSKPNWTLTIGNNLPKLELRVRQLEQRDEISVSLLLEEEKMADIATTMIPSPGVESLRLKILCDLEEGRFVLQQNGRTIGEISSKSKAEFSSAKFDNRVRFQLTNDAPGGMILRELKVSRSPFSMARSIDQVNGISQANQPASADRLCKVVLKSGRSLVGAIKTDSSRNGMLKVETAGGDQQQFTIDEMERIEFASMSKNLLDETGNVRDTNDRSDFCSLQTNDGERFTGESLLQTVDGITLICASVATPIRFSSNEIASVQFIRSSVATTPNSDAPIPMKLVCDGAHSNGWLVPSETAGEPNGSDGWAWRPASLSRSFLLNAGIDGTIDVIRAGADTQTVDAQSRNLSLRTDIYGRSLDPGEPSLYLVNGDSLPGKVVRMDESTIFFHSEFFGESTVAASQVRGIRQLVYTGSDRFDPILLKRLLTVPRMYRLAPPAHLVVSRDGDMIRGNVFYIDEDLLRISVRDEQREIWMKNVAEIIWLEQASDLEESKNDLKADVSNENAEISEKVSPSSPGQPEGMLVKNEPVVCQLVMRKGSVVSLVPAKMDGGMLLGVHPLLGECNIPLDQTVKILFGAEIEKARSESRFAKWKLRHAIDPKFVTDEADSETGEASELIGKPAIDFELKSLDGSSVKLSALRGRVVVLDFWASWCGPCRKSLPVVQGVAQDFESDPFSFYAINVDEEQNVVRGSAIVLGISNNCLLDPKAIVSKSYGANAIPYTVLIDKEGIVRRVFIGANDESFATLREAIAKYLETASP